jgi:carbon monoxide dehydrogenase subunit G
MRFEQRLEVQAEVAEVWGFLWDVQRLARCLPGCQEVRELQPQKSYEVVVEERVGPFNARFEMDVEVKEMRPEQLVRLIAAGKDKKLGASTRSDLEVKLETLDFDGTALHIVADIQVIGKIAALGQVVIKRKAREIVGEFAKAIAAELKPKPVRLRRRGGGN